MSKSKKKLFLSLISVALVLTVGFTFVFGVQPAVAGSERIQFFRDDFSYDEIDDYNWTIAKGDNTALKAGSISNEGVVVFNGSSLNAIRYNDTVTLAEGEKLEMTFTVDNALSLFIMPSFNGAAYYAVNDDGTPAYARPYASMRLNIGAPMGINNVLWDYDMDGEQDYKPDVIASSMYNHPHVVKGENNTGDGKDAWINQNAKFDENASLSDDWATSATTIGSPDWSYSKPLEIKAVYGADGSMYYYVRHEGDVEWSTACFIQPGIKVLNNYYNTPDGSVSVGGLARDEGLPVDNDDDRWNEANGDYITTGGPELTDVAAVPAIAIMHNVASAVNVSVRNITLNKIGADGQSSVVSTSYEDWQEYENNTAEVQFGSNQPSLVIENAEDDDVLVKRTAITAPDNNLNPYLYDIEMYVYAENATGDAEGILYIGGDDEDLTNATEIYLKASGTGYTVGIRGDTIQEAPVAFNQYTKEFVKLRIRNLKDGTNEVYIGEGTAEVKVGTFEKELAGTYFGFGMKKNGGNIRFAVKNMLGYRYNYLQGTGGDFVETFDDGLYDADNLLIQVHPEFADPDMLYIEDGKLVFNAAQGVTINTMHSYSDYEFTFTLSYATPAETDSVFGLGFGKPIAEAGDCLVWFQLQKSGTFVVPDYPNNYIDYDRENGYHEWSSPFSEPEVLDPDTDEVITPGWTNNIYAHDYEESSLTVKIVKQDSTMKIYAYTDAQKEANHKAYTTPFTQFINCYGFGCIDIRCLSTGVPVTMSIDEISFKNLDETKGDIETSSGTNRVNIVLDKVEVVAPPEGEDPVNPVIESEFEGCNSSFADTSIAVSAALIAAAAVFFVTRRTLKRKDR